ncbi:MAG: P-II family nitrogen regulator [Clostridia bacterium]|nr:P-II family nitrogen regulator [Clostridia bacterium]
MKAGEYDLIITVVNKGSSDDVMTAARKAGAYGGTLVNARGTGTNEYKKFFGTVVEPEKEMVMIIAEHASRNAIMEAVAQSAGLSKKGMGLTFSLPIDRVIGMSAADTEGSEQTE